MRIERRIAARHSDLARLQAQHVGRALEATHPTIKIHYDFRASLGDVNLQDPLWKMPEKGVFTEDFVTDLVERRADFVVHSWKDLPTAPRPQTEVVATLPRADARDLLFVRADRLDGARAAGRLRVLTSSPRRAYNLGSFLPEALPLRPAPEIQFLNVRGNVPTRLRKLFEGDADALVVAKAAIDRLLETEDWGSRGDEYASVRREIRARLAACRWMVLPLSANPGAAAQGALAIEILRGDEAARSSLQAIACRDTFAAVEAERAILASHGGGCHQKIGVAHLRRPWGTVTFVRGLTDAGVRLDVARLDRPARVPRAGSVECLYPGPGEEATLFAREPLPRDAWEAAVQGARGLWVSRENALPNEFAPSADQLVWCAGAKSWRKLAARGVWVNGCADGLGETEDPAVERLTGGALAWTKVSHDASDGIATYRLAARTERAPNFRDKTHFFWMSGSAFREALRRDPTLARRGHHACGPGKTAAVVATELGCDALGEPGRFAICLSAEAWRLEALGQLE